MFITFIYRIENDPKTYFGKYCADYVSDDHEGLDKEILDFLLNGINKYRKQNNLEKITNNNIKLGVLSFSSNQYVPVCSSDDEVKCFDFYCKYYDRSKNSIIYINGKIV
jgi:hypothetical protein